uniref:Uncharacterized protein n=1 Tax=viral metagenome TaxID=1070528 RepID=A0A6C0ARH8_9ZZZZ
MEDSIEENRSTLYNTLKIERKLLYVYIPNEKNDYKEKLLTHNKEVAVEFANYNNCKVEIFICYL